MGSAATEQRRRSRLWRRPHTGLAEAEFARLSCRPLTAAQYRQILLRLTGQ
jgi:hypothetical protein